MLEIKSGSLNAAYISLAEEIIQAPEIENVLLISPPIFRNIIPIEKWFPNNLDFKLRYIFKVYWNLMAISKFTKLTDIDSVEFFIGKVWIKQRSAFLYEGMKELGYKKFSHIFMNEVYRINKTSSKWIQGKKLLKTYRQLKKGIKIPSKANHLNYRILYEQENIDEKIFIKYKIKIEKWKKDRANIIRESNLTLNLLIRKFERELR